MIFYIAIVLGIIIVWSIGWGLCFHYVATWGIVNGIKSYLVNTYIKGKII